MKRSNDSWLVPSGFASHRISELDPLLSPERETESQTYGVEATYLIYQIFSIISQNEAGAGVTDIALALDTSKARISRQMQTLHQLGMVERCTITRRYKIGRSTIAWGLRGLRFLGVNENVSNALAELRDATGGRAVIFSILEKNWGRVVLSLRSTRGEPLAIPVGAPLIFPRSPSARVLWAFDERKEDLLKSARAAGFIHHTGFSSIAELNDSLDDTRRARVAATLDVRLNNLGSVAAPVFDANNRLLGCIAAVDFSDSLRGSKLEQLTGQVRIAADNLSKELGSGSLG